MFFISMRVRTSFDYTMVLTFSHLKHTAVVTGATDGIGKAMAFEFGKKGLNVVLISRSKDKLTACQDELKAKCPKIEVKTLAVDYGKFDEASRQSVTR
jgi:short-subunit dehydrogenase